MYDTASKQSERRCAQKNTPLDGFNLEMQRDEGENQALSQYTRQQRATCTDGVYAHLQILHKVVKDPQTLRVFTILDVNKRTNFGSLWVATYEYPDNGCASVNNN